LSSVSELPVLNLSKKQEQEYNLNPAFLIFVYYLRLGKKMLIEKAQNEAADMEIQDFWPVS
jgi:hypothetical protein